MIHLHLGAHKTATTYLQTLLADNQGIIERAGRTYLPLDRIRPLIAHAIWLGGSRTGVDTKAWLRRRATRNHPHAGLGRLVSGVGEAIVSDENILGNPEHCLAGRFYPNAHQRLSAIAREFGGHEVQIWLSLRNYPTFLSSLYAEALRHGAFVSPERFVADNAEPAGQWPAVVGAIQAAFPAARIVVWRYEQFRDLSARVIEGIAGVPYSELKQPAEALTRPSPSRRAVAALCEKAPSLSRSERTRLMTRLEDESPLLEGEDRFDPWTQMQAKCMATAYEADLAEIRSLSFVDMLEVCNQTGF